MAAMRPHAETDLTELSDVSFLSRDRRWKVSFLGLLFLLFLFLGLLFLLFGFLGWLFLGFVNLLFYFFSKRFKELLCSTKTKKIRTGVFLGA